MVTHIVYIIVVFEVVVAGLLLAAVISLNGSICANTHTHR